MKRSQKARNLRYYQKRKSLINSVSSLQQQLQLSNNLLAASTIQFESLSSQINMYQHYCYQLQSQLDGAFHHISSLISQLQCSDSYIRQLLRREELLDQTQQLLLKKSYEIYRLEHQLQLQAESTNDLKSEIKRIRAHHFLQFKDSHGFYTVDALDLFANLVAKNNIAERKVSSVIRTIADSSIFGGKSIPVYELPLDVKESAGRALLIKMFAVDYALARLLSTAEGLCLGFDKTKTYEGR